jgi:hypothetical protein
MSVGPCANGRANVLDIPPPMQIPINQDDIRATLLAFGINALVGVEYVGGIAISQGETKNYLAVWHYIGWLLGVYCSGDSWTSRPQRKRNGQTC